MQPVMSTLVTEDKLADAILEENANAIETNEAVESENARDDVFLEEILSEERVNSESKQEENVLSQEVANEVSGEDVTNGELQEEKEKEIETQRMESYVIQKGDTLIAISTSIYGSDAAVGQICALNNISNPDNIQIGQKILLP